MDKVSKFKTLKIHPFILINNIMFLKNAKGYDVVHVHGVTPLTFLLKYFVSNKTKIILSYYGSDLFRSKKLERLLQKLILKKAEYITFATHKMIDTFNVHYKNKYALKIKKIMYGSKNVEYFSIYLKTLSVDDCKTYFSMPSDKFSIYIGYNGYREHRHLEVISELTLLNHELKEKIFVVCHISYGLDEIYANQIENKLISSGIHYIILKEFYSGKELVYLRKACNVFINVQPSDALSASMIESMSAGAVVLKGSWLAYKEIDDLNGFYLNLNSLTEITDKIVAIINDWTNYKLQTINNGSLLFNLLSWEVQAKKWIELY